MQNIEIMHTSSSLVSKLLVLKLLTYHPHKFNYKHIGFLLISSEAVYVTSGIYNASNTSISLYEGVKLLKIFTQIYKTQKAHI